MKKFIIISLFLISVLSFSLDKSGIKEYDSLKLSEGRTIAYFNEKKNIVEEPYATFYRKEYGKLNNLHIIADFYADTDTPEKIFLLKDLDDEDSINGKLVYYGKDGSISYTADMKNGKIDGKKVTYDNGEMVASINFTNNLANGKGTLFYKGKKYAEATYTHGFVDGDFVLYYPDGSKVLTQTYVDNDIVSSKNVNYKLQKSEIPEFDNIDLSKGEIIHHYTFEGKIINKDSKDAFFYRKLISEENGLYLVVDFFSETDNVQGIAKVYNLKDFQGYTLDGPAIIYYDNGNLKSKAFYKNKKLDGEYTSYNYNGVVNRIDIYKDGKIQEAKFINQ